jgi:uncharacterized protein (DUF2141 family)
MHNSTARFVISVLSLSLTSAMTLSECAAAASNNQLTVMIDGLKNQQGQVCLSLFSQPEGFPAAADRAVTSRCVPVSEISDGIILANLPSGNYAIAVFHDANADGKLNTGIFGIPKEGFGFSRNPRITTRAPRFNETAFTLDNQATQIQIQMTYF